MSYVAWSGLLWGLCCLGRLIRRRKVKVNWIIETWNGKGTLETITTKIKKKKKFPPGVRLAPWNYYVNKLPSLGVTKLESTIISLCSFGEKEHFCRPKQINKINSHWKTRFFPFIMNVCSKKICAYEVRVFFLQTAFWRGLRTMLEWWRGNYVAEKYGRGAGWN